MRLWPVAGMLGPVKGFFLPVAARELRVASKKRSTSRLRTLAALTAFVIALVPLLTFALVPMVGTAARGQIVFRALTWLAFMAALCSGLFLTADAISEEKREGTYGLLFLTDLTGIDIILGKLVASSIVAFYALLATIPVMAIPLLLGGVTSLEFWQCSLALVITMFVSLASGLFISTLHRNGHRAMFVTFGLLVVLALGGLLVDYGVLARSSALFARCSPAFLLWAATERFGSDFGSAAIVQVGMALLFLLGAVCMAPLRWQDSGTHPGTSSRGPGEKRRTNQTRPSARTPPLSTQPPLQWLHTRRRGAPRLVLIWALLVFAGAAALLLSAEHNELQSWSFFFGASAIPLYLLASTAGSFLIDGRRSGSLELLLTTPAQPREIILGQWRAWRRQFGLAVCVIVIAQATLSIMGAWQTWTAIAGLQAPPLPPPPPAATAGATNAPARANTKVVAVQTGGVVISRSGMTVYGNRQIQTFGWPMVAGAVVLGVVSALATVLNLAANFWFGLWTGLTATKPALSSLKTLLMVQALPWLGIYFCSFVLIPILMFRWVAAWLSAGNLSYWYMGVMTFAAAILTLTKDFLFIRWARSRLFSELPRRATLARIDR